LLAAPRYGSYSRPGYNIWEAPLLSEPVGFSYLVVVAASEPALYQYLKQRFEPDPTTHVILDRRRRLAPSAPVVPPVIERRRLQTAELLSSQRVAVVRLADDPAVSRDTHNETAGEWGRVSMEGMDGLEDRQRVDRWLEESQYLIGRMIPAYLDDRERVRGRLEMSDKDNERLRGELSEARREIAELRSELEVLRSERLTVAESFNAIVEHLTALQKPVNEISRHVHPVPASPEVHASYQGA
jgi:hypothetical protein